MEDQCRVKDYIRVQLLPEAEVQTWGWVRGEGFEGAGRGSLSETDVPCLNLTRDKQM